MLMFKSTHMRAMTSVQDDALYERRRLDSAHRNELDRKERQHVDHCRKLNTRIKELETTLELTAAARDTAIQALNDRVMRPFKWGAEPAPEAKRSHLVDQAMALAPFPVLCPDFASLEARCLALRRYPYAGVAGPTTGRMPGAGSIKP